MRICGVCQTLACESDLCTRSSGILDFFFLLSSFIRLADKDRARESDSNFTFSPRFVIAPVLVQTQLLEFAWYVLRMRAKHSIRLYMGDLIWSCSCGGRHSLRSQHRGSKQLLAPSTILLSTDRTLIKSSSRE